MTTLQQLILVGASFLLVLLTGFWLGRLGKPYAKLLFSIHKLIALGVVVGSILILRNLLIGMELSVPTLLLLAAGAAAMLALFITGAFMSLDKKPFIALKAIHWIAMVMAALSAGGLFYLIAITL